MNCTPYELMNTKTPNHIGLEIGRVVNVTKDKIKIKLTHPLNQQDGIRFFNSQKGFIVNYIYDEKGKMINSSSDICYVDNKVNLVNNDIVCKTQDYKLMNELKKYNLKKLNITIKAKCLLGQPFEITLFDGINEVVATGEKVQKSINAPVTVERIKDQLLKLGETPFICNEILVESDNDIFIPIKEINELRRQAVNKLITIKERSKKEFIINDVYFKSTKQANIFGLSATVNNEEQVLTCLELKFDRIYITDEQLYEKYKNNINVYYKLPRCARNIDKILKEKNISSDYFDFQLANTIGDYGLNVYNAYTVYYLNKLGIALVNVSVELNESEIRNLIKNYQELFKCYPSIEVLAYGRVENMIIKNNILDITNEMYSYNLIDIKKRKFPVYFDGVNTHILNYQNNTLNLSDVKEKTAVRFDFFNENEKQIRNIIKSI